MYVLCMYCLYGLRCACLYCLCCVCLYYVLMIMYHHWLYILLTWCECDRACIVAFWVALPCVGAWVIKFSYIYIQWSWFVRSIEVSYRLVETQHEHNVLCSNYTLNLLLYFAYSILYITHFYYQIVAWTVVLETVGFVAWGSVEMTALALAFFLLKWLCLL